MFFSSVIYRRSKIKKEKKEKKEEEIITSKIKEINEIR